MLVKYVIPAGHDTTVKMYLVTVETVTFFITDPAIEYITNEILTTLLQSLEETLVKAKEMQCIKVFIYSYQITHLTCVTYISAPKKYVQWYRLYC